MRVRVAGRRILSLLLITCLFAVGLDVLPESDSAEAQAAPRSQVLIASAIEEGPVVPGGVFFEKSVTVDFSGGDLSLSGDQGGTAPLFVDDILRLSVDHEDGSSTTFSHDFSHGCQGTIARDGPFDIKSYLEPGTNKVRVEFADQCGVGASSSDVWLVGDFEVGGGIGGIRTRLVSAIEEGPVVPGGVFFQKTMTIRPGGGELVLSGDQTGSEPLFVDDILHLSIVHEDGSSATFSNDFSHGCQGFIAREGPFDIQSYLEPGTNDVRVELADQCGVGASSSDIWLVGDYQLGGGGSGGEARLAQVFGPPGRTTHGQNQTGSHADPVNTAIGAYYTSVVDATLPNIGLPFSFQRSYTSADTTTGLLGIGWTHSLGAQLTVASNGDVTLRGEDGQQLVFTKQADGSFQAPPAGRSRLAAVADGYELVRHDQVRYRFDTAGRLQRMEDRNGQGLTLAYDREGHLTRAVLSGGRTVRFRSNTDGLLTSLRLPDGRRVRYDYADGRLSQVTDVRGKVTRYTYDTGGRLASVIDPNGHAVVRNTYGSDGRILEQRNAVGNLTSFAWDPDKGIATITDPLGNNWQHLYKDNVLVGEVDPLGHEIKYDYDSDLNRTAVTDGRGNTTTMEYDDRGNLMERVAPAPLSFRQRLEYNAMNDPISVTDGRGNTTSFNFDSKGNLVRRTDPNGAVTSFTRDADTGLLASLTDPNGHTTRLHYDRAGNLIRAISPRGGVTTTTFDAGGRLIAVVDPRGNTGDAKPGAFRTRLVYDRANRLRRVIDPLGHRTRYRYDAAGNLVRRTDANGHSTRYSYDEANRLVAVTAPDGAATRYAYDPNGNLVQRTDANGHSTRYAYDEANRRVETRSPIGQRWTLAYDPAGNPTTLVTAAGNATPTDGDGAVTMTYDAANRPTKIEYSDDTPKVSVAYDANGNLIQMIDGAGTETRTYDAQNRLSSVARSGSQFHYRYDPAGNLLHRTYPDGTRADLAYNVDRQLTKVTSGGSATRYGYDAAGNLRHTRLPNHTTETRTYDRAGRLIRVRSSRGHRLISDVVATLDPAGKPLMEQRPEGTVRYRYDAQDRLTRACYSASCDPADGVIRYRYDPVGNRISEARRGIPGAGSYHSAFDAADQLLSTRGPKGVVSYDYDHNGNQTAAGSRRYGYDLANRLTKATVHGRTTTYTYDGTGKRQTADTGDSNPRTRYTWDASSAVPQLVAEQDGQDQLQRRYLYGNDRISMTTQTDTSYYHHDRIGSVTALTSADGENQWAYSYEPFGAIHSADKRSSQAPENPMRFAGEYQDPTTSLYHLRTRELDPTLGKFLQRDPIEGDISDPYVSAYVYARNIPTALVDPTGLTPSWFTSELEHDLGDAKDALTLASIVFILISFFGLAGPFGLGLGIIGLVFGLIGVIINLVELVGKCGDEGRQADCLASLLELELRIMGLGMAMGRLMAGAAGMTIWRKLYGVLGIGLTDAQRLGLPQWGADQILGAHNK